MMIYVSSSCVQAKYIWDGVEELALAGFKNIELSGGTDRSALMIEKLLTLRDKFNLRFRCHNYFPPPQQHFVMNLASESQDIQASTRRLIDEALEFSAIVGGSEYGFHAGFLTDITTKEIGKQVAGRRLSDRSLACGRFVSQVEALQSGDSDIKLYIENNVVSKNNYANFENKNPFLLTLSADFLELSELVAFNLLLDVAHLYVSANTLGATFLSEYLFLVEKSDYLHVSDNDGRADQNRKLREGSDIYCALSQTCLKEKTITLEVNDDIAGLEDTYQMIDQMIA